MTNLKSASIVLLSVAVLAGCGNGDATPRPATGEASAAEAQKPPATGVPAAAASAAPDGQPGTNAQGAATLEFQKRIANYLKIHNEAETKVPNLKNTDDPKLISDREASLAKMIQTLRAGAVIGEIFAPEYQPFFIKIVQDDFATRPARDRKALVNELPKNMKVDVNTVYPTTLPLETFPAGLLRKLPDLPPELEYRIVGRSLILRDVKANLIVDILRDVVPTIPS
jgi:hypothetical protein